MIWLSCLLAELWFLLFLCMSTFSYFVCFHSSYLLPYRTKFRQTNLPNIRLSVEKNFRWNILFQLHQTVLGIGDENFVRRKILSAEILSKVCGHERPTVWHKIVVHCSAFEHFSFSILIKLHNLWPIEGQKKVKMQMSGVLRCTTLNVTKKTLKHISNSTVPCLDFWDWGLPKMAFFSFFIVISDSIWIFQDCSVGCCYVCAIFWILWIYPDNFLYVLLWA